LRGTPRPIRHAAWPSSNQRLPGRAGFGAGDAEQRITANASWTAAITADVAVILAFTAAALGGGALTLRRRIH
jgi:hypothetical protein